MDYLAPSAHLFGVALLINKDGKQLGPFSLEEARGMVLSGKLTAQDWAWPDGATDWTLLKDVPGFSTPKPAPPSVVPGQTADVAATEQNLWTGHPSQTLNLHIYLFWAMLLIVALAAGIMLVGLPWWSILIFGMMALSGMIHSTIAYIHLRAVQYVVTNQRVRIISGIFSKDITEIELFRVKDTMAHQSFLLRLFGLGTITILSGDERQPRLVLTGVPHAVELREKLRQEVMNLRQRFGVREVDVM